MTNFNVRVTSDVVCPWCYIGSRKLDKAIVQYQAQKGGSNDTFSVSWAPFALDPGAPKKGVERMVMLREKFGEARAQVMQARVTEEGAKVGIDFQYGGKTGATFDAHRVIALAHKLGGSELQNNVVRALFRSYFEKEGDITDHGMLADAAATAGMDRTRVLAMLESADTNGITKASEKSADVDDSGIRAQVAAELEQVRRERRVTGVPNFVINDRYEIQGAQDPDALCSVFEQIKALERS